MVLSYQTVVIANNPPPPHPHPHTPSEKHGKIQKVTTLKLKLKLG